MTKQAKLHKMNAIRTEIAFAIGDQMHGGPSHKNEIERLRQELKELEAVETED